MFAPSFDEREPVSRSYSMSEVSLPLRQRGQIDHFVSAISLQRLVIWLAMFSSCVAVIEPSPFEIMFTVMALAFLVTRLPFSLMLVPMIVLLALYNVGGLIALMPFTNDSKAVMFILISIYMAVAGTVFAAIMLEDTERRALMIESGWIAAAIIASIAGILGYFNIAGLGSVFSFNERASGTFKDPNVLGVYLLFPFVSLVLGFVLGNRRFFLYRAFALVIIAAAIFLSFSRGAWGLAVLASGLAIGLAFITSRSTLQKARIIFVSLIAVGALAVMVMLILSIDQTRELFLQRFSLQQSYDVESGGRFDNQAKAIPMLLNLPNGFGPFQFRTIFPEDPHNVYVNAFASYGWLGGFSYMALTLVTLAIGWRGVFIRSRVQPIMIACWSTLFCFILQGFTIDTDHWRHYYVLLGMVWGLYIVAMREQRAARS
jgi:O-Antigen ligase